MSSIDWLSDSLSTPMITAPPHNEPPIARTAGIETISVTPLGAPSPDGIGLISRREAGLPGDLWKDSDLDQLRRLIAALPVTPIPAQQDLIRLILLTDLDPPIGSGPEGLLFQSRIDALLARGALDEASKMLERTGSKSPALFQRSFDVALLQGKEDFGCRQLRATPGISPSFTTRIFCLARTGDWQAAALTLETARALKHIDDSEDVLLARFLDPELADGATPLLPPKRPSPLTFRMLEAIGEPLPTTQLPIAFAHADLRDTAGWRTRIGAAERLARVGSLPPEQLMEIYAERQPAASGGVWERVAAVQSLQKALAASNPADISRALPEAWEEMKAANLAVPFATHFAPALEKYTLTGPAQPLAFKISLLAPNYERSALTHGSADSETDRFLTALAKGLPGEAEAPNSLARAIADGFSEQPMPEAIARPIAAGRLGEAILQAMKLMENGTRGELNDVTTTIAFLRKVNLEDTARRYGLQLMLLGPQG